MYISTHSHRFLSLYQLYYIYQLIKSDRCEQCLVAQQVLEQITQARCIKFLCWFCNLPFVSNLSYLWQYFKLMKNETAAILTAITEQLLLMTCQTINSHYLVATKKGNYT